MLRDDGRQDDCDDYQDNDDDNDDGHYETARSGGGAQFFNAKHRSITKYVVGAVGALAGANSLSSIISLSPFRYFCTNAASRFVFYSRALLFEHEKYCLMQRVRWKEVCVAPQTFGMEHFNFCLMHVPWVSQAEWIRRGKILLGRNCFSNLRAFLFSLVLFNFVAGCTHTSTNS